MSAKRKPRPDPFLKDLPRIEAELSGKNADAQVEQFLAEQRGPQPPSIVGLNGKPLERNHWGPSPVANMRQEYLGQWTELVGDPVADMRAARSALSEVFGREDREHLAALRRSLDGLGIAVHVDDRLGPNEAYLVQERDLRAAYPRLSPNEVAPDDEDNTGDLFPEVESRVEVLPNDRYTTTPTLDWCKRVLGVDAFDLDVAATWEAHHAPRWYGWQGHPRENGHWVATKFVDGLKEPWDAARIWCNPPYDDLAPWVQRAWRQLLEHRELKPVLGMLIPDNRREQPFWQNYVEPYRDGRRERIWTTHFKTEPPGYLPRIDTDHAAAVAYDAGVRLYTHSLPGRQPFGVPGNPQGIGQASPPFGVVLLEWRLEG